jgi:hypothetical protein
LTGKLRFGFRGLGGEVSAVARTEVNIIGVGLLASGADLHERQLNPPVAWILTEVLPQRESSLDGRHVVLGGFAIHPEFRSSSRLSS